MSLQNMIHYAIRLCSFCCNVTNHRNELLCSRPTEFQTPELAEVRATRSDGTGIPGIPHQAELRATNIYYKRLVFCTRASLILVL